MKEQSKPQNNLLLDHFDGFEFFEILVKDL